MDLSLTPVDLVQRHLLAAAAPGTLRPGPSANIALLPARSQPQSELLHSKSGFGPW